MSDDGDAPTVLVAYNWPAKSNQPASSITCFSRMEVDQSRCDRSRYRPFHASAGMAEL
jgi:hypothetical protein